MTNSVYTAFVLIIVPLNSLINPLIHYLTISIKNWKIHNMKTLNK